MANISIRNVADQIMQVLARSGMIDGRERHLRLARLMSARISAIAES